jgi:hypothetical protein
MAVLCTGQAVHGSLSNNFIFMTQQTQSGITTPAGHRTRDRLFQTVSSAREAMIGVVGQTLREWAKV